MTDLDIVATALTDLLCADRDYFGGPDRFMAGDSWTWMEAQKVYPDDMRTLARRLLDTLNHRGLYVVEAQWDDKNDCIG